MSSPLRLVFLGSDPIALPLLNWLAGDEARAQWEVVAVFTQPDRATGRGQVVTANAIKTWALERKRPVLQPEKVTPAVQAQLAEFRPDIALVMAYGHILKDDFINTPRLGTLNLHTSLLPKYRGASPIQTAIAEGERQTGVTLMRIVRRLDAGPVGDVEKITIDALDTAGEVEVKLAQACVPLLARALPKIAMGTLDFAPQDDAQATYCRKLQKSDGGLDFTAPARVLAARINGLFPWPSCQVSISGQPIKLGLADAADMKPGGDPPGSVLEGSSGELLVATGDGVLRLRRLQRPGGKMLAAADFLRGFAVPPGTLIPSQAMPALLETRPARPAG